MSGYIGTQPVPQATQTRDAFTATAAQTSFATGGYTPGFLDVFLNGVKLAAADYTATNGSDVVLAVGAALSDIVETVAYTSFVSANNATLAQGALADTAVQPNDSPTFATVTATSFAGIPLKAWVRFNGTGVVAIDESFNVSSITDNGTGIYSINFTTNMSSTTYGVNGSTASNTTDDGSNNRVGVINKYTNFAVGSFKMRCHSAADGTVSDVEYATITVYN